MSERGNPNRISFLLVGAAPFGKEETGTFRSTLRSTLSVALSAVGYSPGYHPCSTLGFKPSREGDNQGRSRRLNNLPVCGRHRFGFTVGGCALCSWRLSLCGQRCLALCSRRCLTLRGCLSYGIIRRSLRSWRLRGLASRFRRGLPVGRDLSGDLLTFLRHGARVQRRNGAERKARDLRVWIFANAPFYYEQKNHRFLRWGFPPLPLKRIPGSSIQTTSPRHAAPALQSTPRPPMSRSEHNAKMYHVSRATFLINYFRKMVL